MRALQPAAAAVTFLTRVPLGRVVSVDAADIARGAWLFPLVGGAVGLLGGLVADAAATRLPPLAAGLLAVGAMALVTGAMHLDALADTADALGGLTRERSLEIMRDHAVGAFGAVALVVVCLLDAVLLGALAAGGDAALVALAAGAAGRALILPVAATVPYARTGDGQGRALAGMPAWAPVLALALAAALALPAGRPGLAGLAAAAAVAVAVTVFALRRFGGVTGDVLGTVAKLGETAALLAAVAVVA
jgi:adenosylcobinamide-GDP ribazoletransferase